MRQTGRGTRQAEAGFREVTEAKRAFSKDRKDTKDLKDMLLSFESLKSFRSFFFGSHRLPIPPSRPTLIGQG